MANLVMRGLDEYTQAISRLERGVRTEVCGAAIYRGADIVANSIRDGINGLPDAGGRGSPEKPLPGPNKAQKSALQRSFGLSPLRDDDGYLNVKAGFSGYNNIRTKHWPSGQPNAMVARSVERGTSFMTANPFVKQAVARSKKTATDAMRATVEEKIQTIMETERS